MKPVVILDFDGPLFPEKIFLYPQNKGTVADDKCCELNLHSKVTYWYADPFAIAILNELKEKYDYKLVISSSWADENLHNKEQIENLLKANGLVYDLHEDWKTRRSGKRDEERATQVEEWLSRHPEVGEHYFVLDDTKSAPELFFEKTYLTSTIDQRNVYLAHEKDGFSYEQFTDMDFLMGYWQEKEMKKSTVKSSNLK